MAAFVPRYGGGFSDGVGSEMNFSVGNDVESPSSRAPLERVFGAVVFFMLLMHAMTAFCVATNCWAPDWSPGRDVRHVYEHIGRPGTAFSAIVCISLVLIILLAKAYATIAKSPTVDSLVPPRLRTIMVVTALLLSSVICSLDSMLNAIGSHDRKRDIVSDGVGNASCFIPPCENRGTLALLAILITLHVMILIKLMMPNPSWSRPVIEKRNKLLRENMRLSGEVLRLRLTDCTKRTPLDLKIMAINQDVQPKARIAGILNHVILQNSTNKRKLETDLVNDKQSQLSDNDIIRKAADVDPDAFTEELRKYFATTESQYKPTMSNAGMSARTARLQ